MIKKALLKGSILKHLAMVKLKSFKINFIGKPAFGITCQIVLIAPIVPRNNPIIRDTRYFFKNQNYGYF